MESDLTYTFPSEDGRDPVADARLGYTEYDFKLQNEGTIVVLHPENDAAREWIDTNLYTEQTQWWGGGIVIEHRYVQEVLDDITDQGFTIGRL